uniref:Uncharacterized protein n=1 Tax=Daphnia magna TaxID=35525 RepID=A0A0P6IX24_9CRUS
MCNRGRYRDNAFCRVVFRLRFSAPRCVRFTHIKAKNKESKEKCPLFFLARRFVS